MRRVLFVGSTEPVDTAGSNVNKDPRLSIASVSIPYGQRFISMDIEAQSNILFTAPGNLFLRLTTEVTTSAGTNKGLATAQAVSDYKRYVTYTPVLASGSNIDTTQRILTADLYINNIFVNPDIHDIFIKRIGFNLIRVYRYQPVRTSNATDSILLAQLKWPIETMFVGLRPARNVDASNPNQYRDWHRMTLMTDNSIDLASKSHSKVVIDNAAAWNATATNKAAFSQETSDHIVYPSFTETVDTLQLQAHGINIFQQYDAQFFRDYATYTWGGINIVTPEDPGVYMLNFCLYPGTYQPSGHINVSRAREFYLQFTSSYCSPSTPCDLLVLAIAINFILISDGSKIGRAITVDCPGVVSKTSAGKQCNANPFGNMRQMYIIY